MDVLHDLAQAVRSASKVDVKVQEDVLVLDAPEGARCEIWIDWLDLEDPFCLELCGTAPPLRLYGKTMQALFVQLKRAKRMVPVLDVLFQFKEKQSW